MDLARVDTSAATAYAGSAFAAGTLMKGTVIGFDPDTNTGALTGEDGRRYNFATADWRGLEAARRGDVVDFVADGDRATQIVFREAAYVRPSIGRFYFSPYGRLSRGQYWLGYVLPVFTIAVILRLAALAHGETTANGGAFLTLLNVFYLAALWPSVAVLAKRVHDRNKSGWLILIFYVPFFIGLALAIAAVASTTSGDIHTGNQIANFAAFWFAGVGLVGIWFFIDFGCLRGTAGANKYGPDPLQRR